MSTSRKYRAERSAKLLSENPALKREVEAAHRAGYEEGARVTTLTAYLAVSDWGLDGISWLTDRMRAADAKKAMPYSKEIDNAVTHSIVANMKKYSPKRAAEVEAAFADFLAGDSKS
jgi:hypothetical protein